MGPAPIFGLVAMVMVTFVGVLFLADDTQKDRNHYSKANPVSIGIVATAVVLINLGIAIGLATYMIQHIPDGAAPSNEVAGAK